MVSENIIQKENFGSSNAIGFGISAAILLVIFVGAACFCYRKRRGRKKIVERPLTLRRPTALRNPAAHSHYLKKSPSPTGYKSPPGLSRSPGGNGHQAGISHDASPKSLSPNDDTNFLSPSSRRTSGIAFENEKDKPTTPSKEELHLNERNLKDTVDGGNLGRLYFKIKFSSDKKALIVTVVKCTNLPSRDDSMGTCCDPYVKLQLLPDKHHKAKTRVMRKTCNPQYDEDFAFYGLVFDQLQNMTLHFVVLSFDRYSRDDVIGEVVTPLVQLDDLRNTDSCLSLWREILPRTVKGRGEILVSLCHQPAANRLTVVVLKARNLPKMDITGLSDPYVKIYLLSNGQRIAKKKTHVKKRTLNPVFNESFVFDLPQGVKDLSSVSLEFLLLDWDRVTKNEVIGRLELGSSKSSASEGSANHHWNEVVNSPRRQIAEWHKLFE